jgi:hypothetical protein
MVQVPLALCATMSSLNFDPSSWRTSRSDVADAIRTSLNVHIQSIDSSLLTQNNLPHPPLLACSVSTLGAPGNQESPFPAHKLLPLRAVVAAGVSESHSTLFPSRDQRTNLFCHTNLCAATVRAQHRAATRSLQQVLIDPFAQQAD